MVLLVQKFAKFYPKLGNHHHHTHYHDHPQQEEELSASLKAFQFQVSNFFAQLALDWKTGSELILSLSWIQKCFGLLPIINKAFAKLVVDTNHPMGSWEVDLIEGYLNYTLSLLDLLNSMSSSIAHLGHARLSLSHGLTLLENSPSLALKHLKAIPPGSGCFSTSFGKELSTEDDKARIFTGKEGVIQEAVKEMENIGLWVFGVLLSGLCSNCKPYMELRKIAGGFDSASVVTLDFIISEQLIEKIPIFKEVEELNHAIGEILLVSDEVRHDATKELQTKLRVFEKLLDDTSKGVEDQFANVMTQRSELIDCFSLKKQPQK